MQIGVDPDRLAFPRTLFLSNPNVCHSYRGVAAECAKERPSECRAPTDAAAVVVLVTLDVLAAADWHPDSVCLN